MRRIGVGDLDHGQHIADRIHAGTAVFGRHFDAHQAVLAEGTDVLEREFARAVVVLGAGVDLFLGDPARHVLDHQLLFGESEIHGLSSEWFVKPPILTVRRRAVVTEPGKTALDRGRERVQTLNIL